MIRLSLMRMEININDDTHGMPVAKYCIFLKCAFLLVFTFTKIAYKCVYAHYCFNVRVHAHAQISDQFNYSCMVKYKTSLSWKITAFIFL